MVVNVDKGPRVKIDKINFEGNEIFKSFKLQVKLKNTKHKKSTVFGKNQNSLKKNLKKT